jgi:integrase
MTRVNIRFRKDRGYYEGYYREPSTGRRVVKSFDTADARAAQRAAAIWQLEIESGKTSQSFTWQRFRQRFEDEHLRGQPPNTRGSYNAALNHFEKLHGTPTDMNSITGSVLSELSNKLRDAGLGEERIGGVLRHLKVALRFGVRIGAMRACPPIKMPKVVKRKLWRSRAIAEDEFAGLLAAVPGVVGNRHTEGWERLLRGLWLSGLRINEALALSWDSPPLRVVMGDRPRIIVFGEGQKSREDEVLTITPDFAALLAEVPEKQRRGLVFPLTHDSWKIYRETACRIISAIGSAAGIAVDSKGKTLTAHDLRRAFGQRWATRVKPLILQKLMRHKSLTTTMRFYVELEDDDVASAVWLPAWLPAPSTSTEPPTKNTPENKRKSTGG